MTLTQHITPAAGHPFHDPREWEGPLDAQDPDAQIRAGDLVQARRAQTSRTGVAVELNKEGRWVDENGLVLIPKERSGARWGSWRIPSPGPEPLPTAIGVPIYNVVDTDGDSAPWLVLGVDGDWYGQWTTQEKDEDGDAVVVMAAAEPACILSFSDVEGTAWVRESAAARWEERA